ncbi:hypothetical protein NY406_06035 [Chlorobaculum sp. MV4-Y]|jgi:hypothetical protein|uniref:hypothetical protein n=1 Tax=Chlorobaculum sp. MV4-Y TaxID=2976335 RepID=UPI0021B0393E|nr:hypothetical protein [Chlorobaculum sp. MV4-Y]UWX56815.1 hypothetical protein NY406_06035 [Chlorobaculum sp. MV4-Y]
MSTKSITHASPNRPAAQPEKSSDAPVEIKIPQRIVNLPVVPSKKLLRNIVVLVLSAIALAAGWFYFSF